MAHLQYLPGDPRLVDQLVYELKSKGIFDQFRKECIADVDTRPAYQNLRQRVESSVSTFLSRQCWRPDLNKNQLREKLRKHILDGNYLEQGVERIVDQVVNPKVASVFIPQVEDLVYNYLGITRKKTSVENADKPADLLPTDLEAVSPGSVKSNDGKDDVKMDTEDSTDKMEIDKENRQEIEMKELNGEKKDVQIVEIHSSNEFDVSMDKSTIPLPSEEIKLENIPEPENSPPKAGPVELEKIALPKEPVPSTDIPLPLEDSVPSEHFKPMLLQSEDSNSSSDSSIRRNMSPLTPIRNYNNENSCDAQQGFDNDTEAKDNKTEPSSFRFTIESNDTKIDSPKKKDPEQTDLAYQFNNQVNINAFNTPLYDDSSNSNNLRIDYESDTNSKANNEKPETENVDESKKEKKEDKKSHKSSHRSRDSSRHSSSKDKRSDSKHSQSRDRHDKKTSSRDDHKKSSKDRERSKDRSDKKENRESSKSRSSKSSSHRDSKSHRSSSSSHRHSSKSDDKKSSSSSHRDKDKSSKDRSKDSRSSSHRSDKDRKGSSSKKSDEKDKKKDKKDTDDHYSSSGRGNHGRRSTDRDSNDGSSSSKGSQNQNGSKTTDSKKGSKNSSSKSDNTSPASDSTSPSDKDQKLQDNDKVSQFKPAVRVENHLETPIANPPRLPFVPDITLKKPKIAANLEEAKKMMKMRKFLDEEQKRMNQEAALLLEFQANVRPSLSQVYSSIPGPELEFACGAKTIINNPVTQMDQESAVESKADSSNESNDSKETVQPEPESIEQIYNIIIGNPETEDAEKDLKVNITYDENKPFSQLVEEISEYSKASDKAKLEKTSEQSDIIKQNDTETDRSEYFEVTIITENVSESESEEKLNEIEDEPLKIVNKENVNKIESKIKEEISDKSEIIEQIQILNSESKVEQMETEVNLIENEVITETIDNFNEIQEIPEITEPIKTEKSKEFLVIEEVQEIVVNEENNEVGNKEDMEQKTNEEIVEIIPNEKVKFVANESGVQIKEEKIVTNEEKDEANKEVKIIAEETVKVIANNAVKTVANDEVKIGAKDNRIIEQNVDIENPKNIIEKEPLKFTTEIVQETQKADELKYFTEDEKSTAQTQLEDFSKFLKTYTEITQKIYLINCDTYEENIFKEVSTNFGDFEIVNYFKNGHLKLPNSTKNIVKNIPLSTEVTLPIDKSNYALKSPIFSPSKSECSFDLSSDYDAKLDEIVNNKTRQEVMEIILGGIIEEPSKNPPENTEITKNVLKTSEVKSVENKNCMKNKLKRKSEVESSHNRSVLTPTKIRKMSDSDQISSTTEESDEHVSNNNKVQIATRSKYLGKAKRVGLPRPKRNNIVNSPSSDKSVENYSQNAMSTPINGKMKQTPRSKVQRYDTSDLYKPKLHYLSRRNNIS